MLGNNHHWKILGGGEIFIPKDEKINLDLRVDLRLFGMRKTGNEKNTNVCTSPGIKTVYLG